MENINDYMGSQKFLGAKLVGTELDSFRVYNSILELSFRGKEDCWLTITGEIVLDGKCVEHSAALTTFHEIIGDKVAKLKIDSRGCLSIDFDKGRNVVCTVGDSFEDVWSVSPNSSNPYGDHKWCVTLTDEAELVLSIRE